MVDFSFKSFGNNMQVIIAAEASVGFKAALCTLRVHVGAADLLFFRKHILDRFG